MIPSYDFIITVLRPRFWNKVAKRGSDECWLWTGAISPRGYGVMGIQDKPYKRVYAHQVAYILHYGEIPPGKQVNHHCDVKKCMNPAHLYAGTQTENMQDMKDRGPHTFLTPERVRGERNNAARLTSEKVLQIAQMLDTHTGVALARMFHVDVCTISAIKQGRNWSHLTGRTPPRKTP